MTDNIKYPTINVKLVGEDGNAFFIIGKVKKTLQKEGVNSSKFQNL